MSRSEIDHRYDTSEKGRIRSRRSSALWRDRHPLATFDQNCRFNDNQRLRKREELYGRRPEA